MPSQPHLSYLHPKPWQQQEPRATCGAPIEHVGGDTIQIKESNGTSINVRLAQNAKIATVAKASLSDVKPGTFIGTAAKPQPDGHLQAIEIHIFPESMRGTGEGNHAWDAGPGSSMTNGTVGQEVNKV